MTNLAAGPDTVIVKDQNNCTVKTQVDITEPAQLTITLTGNTIKCFGDLTGNVTGVYTGGIFPNYQYLWSRQSRPDQIY